MTHLKTIDILNKLVRLNNDRMKGYEIAISETYEPEVQSLFEGFAFTSQQCRQELADEITGLGGTPTKGTKLSGKIFRLWMDIKAALNGRDLKPIFDSCDFGEGIAFEQYKLVLTHSSAFLSQKQQTIIHRQDVSLKADHTRLKSTRMTYVFAA